MKTKMLGMAAAVALSGVMVAQTVSAAQIEIHRKAGYYAGNGGEFTVYGTGYEANYNALATYTDAANQRTGFQTFCLERNENAVIWTQIPDQNPSIEHYAIAGGYGGVEVGVGGDPISIGTAWLYRQFSDGVLKDYKYDVSGNLRAGTANDLQQAFWILENELDGEEGYDPNNMFILWAGAQLGGLTLEQLQASADPGAYGVAVVNFTKDGKNRQSMLVRVPDGGLTVVLLGLGTLGCAALRRRMA